MYTGIIRELGTIEKVEKIAGGVRLHVAAPQAAAHARGGDSISVDGCCLTTVTNDGKTITFDLSPETLARTVAGSYRAGSRVNIESSMTIGSEVGGHFVTGHVDTGGRVVELRREGDFAVLSVDLDAVAPGLVAEKGSVSVNGVSLTVASWTRRDRGGRFTIALIPETLARTNLDDLAPGAAVNIEYDLIARYVAEALAARGIA